MSYRCLRQLVMLPLVSILAAAPHAWAQTQEKPAETRAMADFGRLNPKAPPETAQYGFLIGERALHEGIGFIEATRVR